MAPPVHDDDFFLSRLYDYTIERSAQMSLFIEGGDDVGYLHESVSWKVSKARVVKFRELETHRPDRKTEPLEQSGLIDFSPSLNGNRGELCLMDGYFRAKLIEFRMNLNALKNVG